jgi:hypothetical protein
VAQNPYTIHPNSIALSLANFQASVRDCAKVLGDPGFFDYLQSNASGVIRIRP